MFIKNKQPATYHKRICLDTGQPQGKLVSSKCSCSEEKPRQMCLSNQLVFQAEGAQAIEASVPGKITYAMEIK